MRHCLKGTRQRAAEEVAWNLPLVSHARQMGVHPIKKYVKRDLDTNDQANKPQTYRQLRSVCACLLVI